MRVAPRHDGMVQHARLRSVLVLFCFSFFGSSSLACGTRVKVEEVRGPQGGEWKAISCSRMNEKCFKTAERLCPNGYVFARAHETAPPNAEGTVTTLPPQDEWRGDMYSKKPGKLLVRCSTSAPKLQASLASLY
jgi:hypothetical protein